MNPNNFAPIAFGLAALAAVVTAAVLAVDTAVDSRPPPESVWRSVETPPEYLGRCWVVEYPRRGGSDARLVCQEVADE